MSRLGDLLTDYLAVRGWGLGDVVPDFSPIPAFPPMPTDGSVVVWVSVPNGRSWVMPGKYREKNYDAPLKKAAIEKLGSVADSRFMGKMVGKSFAHPSFALRGVDYVRAVVMETENA